MVYQEQMVQQIQAKVVVVGLHIVVVIITHVVVTADPVLLY